MKMLFIEESSLNSEIYREFGVFSFPTILIFFDKKEFFRESRNLSIGEFINRVKRPYDLLIGE